MVTFKIIDYGSDSWEKAVNVRENVLRKPLDSVFSDEELKEESSHIHIAGFLHQEIIATAVLVPLDSAIKMQRVAVLDIHRNLSIGSKMMDFCETVILKQGHSYIYCHARNSAVNFYSNNGWIPEGDYFDEDGIPHLKMSKQLIP